MHIDIHRKIPPISYTHSVDFLWKTWEKFGISCEIPGA